LRYPSRHDRLRDSNGERGGPPISLRTARSLTASIGVNWHLDPVEE